ncbi:DUF5753 domain-containing protein [Streptomyces sp. NPDC046465]|uniref:DUF5753 domain-containing protein n=1 Tax=Streptomyces sp. NPDC046465 TaxID=3155810 RepID=UPI0033E04C1A
MNYEASNAELVEALCAMAEERGKRWWSDYRSVLAPGFLDVAELEHHATYLRSLQTVTLPGLLQAEGYVRAIYGGHLPQLPSEELDLRVEFRMKRRRIFERDEPPRFEALIHEAALRMRFGGAQVARTQLGYLREASEWPTVTVRVIPFASEQFIEVTQPVLYAGGPMRELDTVRLAGALGGRSLSTDAGLEKYRALLDVADRAALSVEKSRQLIHDIERAL